MWQREQAGMARAMWTWEDDGVAGALARDTLAGRSMSSSVRHKGGGVGGKRREGCETRRDRTGLSSMDGLPASTLLYLVDTTCHKHFGECPSAMVSGTSHDPRAQRRRPRTQRRRIPLETKPDAGSPASQPTHFGLIARRNNTPPVYSEKDITTASGA